MQREGALRDKTKQLHGGPIPYELSQFIVTSRKVPPPPPPLPPHKGAREALRDKT